MTHIPFIIWLFFTIMTFGVLLKWGWQNDKDNKKRL